MSTKQESDIKRLLKKVDFGEIDGLYDPKLSNYFLDFGFWQDVGLGDKCFVIGRKGTGKSALYNWIKYKESEGNVLVANLSFKDFPFEKFLKLSDDSFSKPNQYQTIWRQIILSELALMVIDTSDSIDDNDHNELREYVKGYFGLDVIDLHKVITRITHKRGGTLKYKNLGYSLEKSLGKDIDDGWSNLTQINRRLESLISNCLRGKAAPKYIVQFDQLDDNYTSYIEIDEYFQCIISLFKVIYDINQSFHLINVPAKAVAYIRSDIFNRVDRFDAESARWEPFKLNLNYAIINRVDWKNAKLLQIMNKRIECSLDASDLVSTKNPFHYIFDNSLIKLQENLSKNRSKSVPSIFQYLIHRTFHRPRDIIQFCIKIQVESIKHNSLYFRTIKSAEKEYSLWLLSEIANEVGPIIPELDALYELLRLIGGNLFSIQDFKNRYARYKTRINMDEEELLKFLYEVGIIINVNPRKFNPEFFSIIRNDRSVFNRDLKIQIHSGIASGLYFSKFAPQVSP